MGFDKDKGKENNKNNDQKILQDDSRNVVSFSEMLNGIREFAPHIQGVMKMVGLEDADLNGFLGAYLEFREKNLGAIDKIVGKDAPFSTGWIVKGKVNNYLKQMDDFAKQKLYSKS